MIGSCTGATRIWLNTDLSKIKGAYTIFLSITENKTYNENAWTEIDEFSYTFPQRSIFVSTIHVPVSRDSDGYIDFFLKNRYGTCKCTANVISCIDYSVVGIADSGNMIGFYVGTNENWLTTIYGSQDMRFCFAEHLIIPLE